MNKEDRLLLLRDLGSRLPFGVKMHAGEEGCYYILNGKNYDIISEKTQDPESDYNKYQPYLRPLSSMTEEERHSLLTETGAKECSGSISISGWESSEVIHHTDWFSVFYWLDSRYFDHRGLIPRGLALVAPPELYRI